MGYDETHWMMEPSHYDDQQSPPPR